MKRTLVVLALALSLNTTALRQFAAGGGKVQFNRAKLDARFKRSLDTHELYGLCLSLFRDNETPHFGITPLVSELQADIEHSRVLTQFVRTYSVTESFLLVPELCQELEVDCVPGRLAIRSRASLRREKGGPAFGPGRPDSCRAFGSP